MNTPIFNFVKAYSEKKMARLHMPGHKGMPFLGCEALDITEIPGADVLSGAEGVILASERNTAALFGTRHSFYSAGGSSQCIGAMLYLALLQAGGRNKILAARNAHKAFFHACALLDLDVDWLYPAEQTSYCSCPVTPAQLDQALGVCGVPPMGVYVTAPDYLGGMQDIAGLAAVCRRYGVPLLVDNAHGAYLRFLQPSRHPMDLGADLCCDSAHKTLPALTGGAYLHVAKHACGGFEENAREALALFGSTSPSYLILQSLDLCVPYLGGDYPLRLKSAVNRVEQLRVQLREKGYGGGQEPLKLTLRAACGLTGEDLARHFRAHGVEGEFADRDFFVMMLTPANTEADLQKAEAAVAALAAAQAAARDVIPSVPPAQQVCSIRQALLQPCEGLPTASALGRICARPNLSCPPAVPIVGPGERITAEVIRILRYYEIETVAVVKKGLCQ